MLQYSLYLSSLLLLGLLHVSRHQHKSEKARLPYALAIWKHQLRGPEGFTGEEGEERLGVRNRSPLQLYEKSSDLHNV